MAVRITQTKEFGGTKSTVIWGTGRPEWRQLGDQYVQEWLPWR